MVQSITDTGSSGVIDQLGYSYDPVLNVTAQTSIRDGGTRTYGYNGLNHLSSVTQPSGYGVPDEAYSYDRLGNRELPADASQYDYDDNNRIIKSPAYTYGYDNDGNQTTRSDGAVFTYDSDNRLTGFSKSGVSASYVYDPYGRRIRKTVNGVVVNYVWHEALVIGEYNAAGATQRRYAYFPEGGNPVQQADANGIYSVHFDHLQTGRFLTNSAQQVVWGRKGGAFGVEQVFTDPDNNGVAVNYDARFPGQIADAETGLYYNVNRYYDPVTGRYTQSDPIGLSGGLNTYTYVAANPINYFDLLGLDRTVRTGIFPWNIRNGNWGGGVLEWWSKFVRRQRPWQWGANGQR